MGFSPFGLLVSLVILAPNLLLLPFPPREGLPGVRVPGVLTVLERAGQALCLVVPAITATGPAVWGWTVVVAAGALGYLGLWVRYLVTGRRVRALYSPVAGVPVPLAILPVVVFLATAAWLSNPWIAVAAVVLAAGHIPASLRIARTLGKPPALPDRGH